MHFLVLHLDHSLCVKERAEDLAVREDQRRGHRLDITFSEFATILVFDIAVQCFFGDIN